MVDKKTMSDRIRNQLRYIGQGIRVENSLEFRLVTETDIMNFMVEVNNIMELDGHERFLVVHGLANELPRCGKCNKHIKFNNSGLVPPECPHCNAKTLVMSTSGNI